MSGNKDKIISQPLWQTLTPEQQEDVLMAFEESELEENLIPFDVIKSKFISDPETE